jgi:glutathione S-transferase
MATSFHAIRNQMGMNVGIRVQLDPSLFSVADEDGNEQFTDLGKDLKRIDTLWTAGLTKFGGPFLAGKEFGAVDAWFAPVVLRLQTYLGAKERLGEAARGYVKRMVELEGVREWVAAALVERERMELYERDCAVGVGRGLVEDLRVKV